MKASLIDRNVSTSFFTQLEGRNDSLYYFLDCLFLHTSLAVIIRVPFRFNGLLHYSEPVKPICMIMNFITPTSHASIKIEKIAKKVAVFSID